MGDDVKPLLPTSIPPYSPRRRRSTSGQAPLTGAVPHHQHNTSLPPLFYSSEHGYRDVYHLKSSSHSLDSVPDFHDPPPRLQTRSACSMESQEHKQQQQYHTQQQQYMPINHQPGEVAAFYQLVPVYDPSGDHASSTLALLPITKENVRRSLDGNPGSSEYSNTPLKPPQEGRPRPMSMPDFPKYREDYSWTTQRSSLDAERPVTDHLLPHHYASRVHGTVPESRDYHNIDMELSTPQSKKSIMRRLKDRIRSIFGKKPKQMHQYNRSSNPADMFSRQGNDTTHRTRDTEQYSSYNGLATDGIRSRDASSYSAFGLSPSPMPYYSGPPPPINRHTRVYRQNGMYNSFPEE